MVFWYFLIIISLIWIIFATIVDIKKREVPDWLNYSLISIGIGSRLIYSIITKEFSYILYGLIGLAIGFGFGSLMYYTKQWGGGDSKLLMGLGAMFGNYNPIKYFETVNTLPFLATFIINILIAGLIYGIIYSLFLGIKNHKNFLKEFKKYKFKEIKIITPIVLVLIILSLIILNKGLYKILIPFFIVILIGACLISLIRIIENISLYKNIDVNKLTEGDWLVNSIYKNKKLICKTRNIGLTKEDIISLKKNNIKEVLIKEGIPFVPSFLIGFIVSIVFGDVILMLI